MKEGINIAKAVTPKVEMGPEKEALKALLSGAVDSLTESEARALVRDITVLEKFLLGVSHPKETHNRSVYKEDGYTAYLQIYHHTRYRGEKSNKKEVTFEKLKSVINGMVNVMPAKRVQELLASPGGFSDILRQVPTVSAKLEGADAKTESAEPEPEEEPIVQVIAELVEQKWAKLPWKKSPDAVRDAIREIFREVGVEVKVEFFRPGEETEKDFIVVAENKEDREKGVLVPKPGTVLDIRLAFDLFKSARPGDKISAAGLVSFPRVERRYTDTKFKDTFWRVTKHGQLKKYS